MYLVCGPFTASKKKKKKKKKMRVIKIAELAYSDLFFSEQTLSEPAQ